MRSHAWYHGPIPRPRAEEIVQKEGDFLIRDCTSQPGNFVLSCKTGKGNVLHFVINKVISLRDTVYERASYQFEEDAYDTVADLITFYVGSGKPISAASGARIQFPCNRTYPLSFYAIKYGNMPNVRGPSPINSPPLINSPGFRYSPYSQQMMYPGIPFPSNSPPQTKREIPPRLPTKKQRSQSLTPSPANAGQHQGGVVDNRSKVLAHLSRSQLDQQNIHPDHKSSSADGVIRGHLKNGVMTRSVDEKFKTLKSSSSLVSESGPIFNSLPRQNPVLNRSASVTRAEQDPTEEQRLDTDDREKKNKTPSPPPKPMRGLRIEHVYKEIPDNRQYRGVVSYHASGSDSGNGSGDSAQSSAANDSLDLVHILSGCRGVVIRNPKYLANSASSVTLKNFVDFDPVQLEEYLANLTFPDTEPLSRFDLDNYQTLLLPSMENKPLDNSALNSFRMMMCENGATIIAHHMTRVDVKLVLGMEFGAVTMPKNEDVNGIELITLKQGRKFREDLVERIQCLKLLVAVTILTCSCDEERAETLNKWIQVAIEVKNAYGNLFGFSAIMFGINMAQIQNLNTTWHILRQNFTDNAFLFEAKLRPMFKAMNEGTHPQAPNTTIPHIVPYILLKDRTLKDFSGKCYLTDNQFKMDSN